MSTAHPGPMPTRQPGSTPGSAPGPGACAAAGDPAALHAWLGLFGLGYAILFALLMLTVNTPVFYGDLSRIGRVSETEFGWRQPQPMVEARHLQGVPIEEADILVLGDSFSQTHRWQSVLVRAGYRVATLYWSAYNEGMCQDFSAWLQNAGFRGRLVIAESVERLLGQRIAASMHCPQMAKPPSSLPHPFAEHPAPVPGRFNNWDAKITVGLSSYLNTQRALATPGDTPVDRLTLVRAVPDGCQLFSNRLCRKALFYGEDETRGELGAAHAQALQALSARHTGTPLLWMIIPNKTTVYLEPAHSAAFVQAFNALGLGPDLFAFAREQRTRIRDFYFPNDSHLSMHGQLALGERMLQEVQKIVPAPGPHGS